MRSRVERPPGSWSLSLQLQDNWFIIYFPSLFFFLQKNKKSSATCPGPCSTCGYNTAEATFYKRNYITLQRLLVFVRASTIHSFNNHMKYGTLLIQRLKNSCLPPVKMHYHAERCSVIHHMSQHLCVPCHTCSYVGFWAGVS